MTIRGKLYAAIVLTVIGPVVTIAVALHGTAELGDRFDEVQARAAKESLARELKFTVTDMNGWQTAYGYDNGRSRPRFVRSADELRRQLAVADRTLTGPPEQAALRELEREFDAFMRLDRVAYDALLNGDPERTKQLFLGPEIRHFEAMAASADRLAAYEADRVKATDAEFDDAREDARRRLIAVGLGAGIVIILLLITANDIARMALEGQRARDGSP
jgi:hypothetical protein